MTLEMTGPMIPADLATLTLREQWNLHYDLIYRPHLATWPADAKLTVSYPSGRPGKCNSAGKAGPTPYDSAHVDLGDVGAIWDCLERFQAPPTRPGRPGGNVWIGVAPRQSGLSAGQRGAGSECYGLPALWIDLDILGGEHKRTDLPTREVADAMIAQCPYPPSLILATGGGLHLYWALSELLDQGHAPGGGGPVSLTDEQLADKDLIGRHKAYWLALGAELGVYVDQAPIASTPHPLRAAGSINGKYGTPVTVVFAEAGRRYSRAELDNALPPLPEEKVQAREARTSRAREVREAIDSGHARPGDRLAAEVPVSDLLLALGMTETGGSGWWSPDGGADHPVHARLYCDPDGRESVTAFDRSLRERWGFEDDHHSLDAFTLLARVLCDGDWGLAARVARQHQDDWPGLLKMVSEQLDPGALAERHPPAAVDVANQTSSAAVRAGKNLTGKASAIFAPKGDPLPWKDVAVARDGWTPITRTQRGDLVFARLGQYPGVWRQHVEMEMDADSQKPVPVTHYTQVVDWVPCRQAVTRFFRGAVEVGAPEWTVCLYTADGKTRQIPELDARTSLDIKLLRTASSAPISIPADLVACALLADVLAKLGHEDIVERRRYLAAGWITDEVGLAVMAAPAGGVSAAGIRTDVEVEVPGKDTTVATVGWREVSSTDAERKAGIEALVALTGLVPTRPEVGVDLAGALFSAPLRLSRRSAHIVVGKKGSGKSLIASAAFSAMAGVGMDGSSFVIKLPQATPAGTVSKAAWCTDLCCFADNYKQRAGAAAARANSKATDCLGVLADGSYDGVADTKATQTGGTREVLPVQTTAIITGEVIPEDDSSSMERAVIIPITKGQVDLTPGTGAVDRYREQHASGNSRRGYADYLQWLAGQVDGGGEITGDGGFGGLRTWADGTKRDYFRRYAAERAGETVACDATGWAAYRAYAAAHGMEDLLPSQPRLDGWLQQLVELTSGAHADTDPGPHLLDGLTGLILERRGHIAAFDGNEPLYAMQWGWTPSTTRGGQNDSTTMRAGGSCLGWLSQDAQFVCVTRTGLRAAARHARLPNLTASQLVECMAGYVVAGTRGDSEPGRGLGIVSRARSWTLPSGIFGFVADDEKGGVDVEPEDTGSVSSPRQGHWADGLDPTLEDLDGLDHDPWDDRAQIG